MQGGRRRLRRALSVACALLLAAGVAWSKEPDAEVARFLLDGGKKACAKGAWDDAIAKLEKSRQEDPSVTEATYWLGYAHDRAGTVPRAVAEYRAYLAATETADPKDREAPGLRRKAAARLDVLAAGDKELAKIEGQLVAQLLAFAKTHFLRDAQVAGEAVRLALAVQPAHDEARKLAERLGVTLPAAGAPPPVREELDLIALRTFGTTSGWSYDGDGLVIDKKGGTVAWPVKSFEAPASFVYETELSFEEEHGESPLLGLTFARTPQSFFAAILVPSYVLLSEEQPGGSRVELKHVDIPLIEPRTTHRLEVRVDGTKVEVLLDGQSKIVQQVEGRETLAGPVGVFHQRSKVRVLSLTLVPGKTK